MPKAVTVQYRHLKTKDLQDGADLKSMVVEALRRQGAGGKALVESARLRKIDLDQDGSIVILNKLSDPGSWDGPLFAAQLIHLEAGTEVQAVTQSLEEDTTEFLLENLQLDAKTSILKGALYFAVVKNHVGIIEGQSVKGRTLERYLTRLLQDADEMEPGQAIILNGRFAAADGKELASSTEVTVRAAPNMGRDAELARAQEVLEREAARAREEGHTVFDVLRTLGWNEDAIGSLKEEIPDDGWIEGFFRVFIKSKKRRKPISRATIDEALRNIDPADLGLRGDGIEKGGLVKLSLSRSVATIGQLLDPSDAMIQIVNALKEWAAQGKIDCTFD
ncbi:hypothetical protein [Defluviimonas salinarum]|uniref:Uncharacterized protein n=1 Tax=Defluviimonas salinarum TaxID=2992147 RepID=A0ABT3JA08_9RHOB|nr:hypothetical protein [Defluviimonas salinarum]MCW3784531.1 hypothetical protein [Defluviimonas salinarum]